MDAENKLMAARREGFCGWAKWGKGGSTDWQLQSSHRAVTHGTGHVVSDLVTNVSGARRAPTQATSA